ncbi:MAG: LacI family DNA-binding transcriptional regulator [Microbacteriaceae bacterium]|nr:LacI family DNA-binding transcriptional regulator [Microbacteriaceae bacterium]
MNLSGKDAHPTIVDVAERAGVSRATASRAIANYGAVGAATRERVQRAAEELGYVPNEIARAMRAGNTRTLGLITTEIGLSFFDLAVRGVIDSARRHGYQVLLANTYEDLVAEKESVRLMLEKRVDGFILVPSNVQDLDHLSPANLKGKPVTLLDRKLAALSMPSITADNTRGVLDAMGHFQTLGHEHIAFAVTSAAIQGDTARRPPHMVSTIDERVNAYFDFMNRANFAVDDRWVRYCGPTEAAARSAVYSILTAANPPTALLASNSNVALAAIFVAKELGLTVGRDLSLIGFDDAPWTTATTPSLTVVDLAVEEMADLAVTNLIAQIEAPQAAHQSTVLFTRLLNRDSVADLR